MNAHAKPIDAVLEAGRCCRRFAVITALAGFALTILTFYPGYMSPDSLAQFEQGLAFHFTDWHPPIMAFAWSLLDAFRPGPEPMLLMQAGLYWGGVYYLLSAIPTRSTAVRWIVAALLFSPALLNFAGVIWVDVQLAAAWSFVIGCTYALRANGAQPRWPVKALLVAILAYGALIRHNSALVAGPLLLYVLTGSPVARRLWITIVIYAAVAIGSLASAQVVSRLLKAEHTAIADALFVFDLAGVSVDSNSNAFPFPLTPAEMATVKGCYDKGEATNPFIWGNCAFIWNKIHSPASSQSARHAWLEAVTHHIPAYLKHRTSHFNQFIDLTTPKASTLIFLDGVTSNNYGFKTRYHGLYHVMFKYIKIFSHTILFRPATWLLLSACIAIAAIRLALPPHEKGFLLAANLTATGYLLTYLPFGVAPDFRYAYVSIAFTTFGLCVLTPRAVALGARRLAGFRLSRGLLIKGPS